MKMKSTKKKIECRMMTWQNSFNGVQLLASEIGIAEMPPQELHQSFFGVNLLLGADRALLQWQRRFLHLPLPTLIGEESKVFFFWFLLSSSRFSGEREMSIFYLFSHFSGMYDATFAPIRFRALLGSVPVSVVVFPLRMWTVRNTLIGMWNVRNTRFSRSHGAISIYLYIYIFFFNETNKERRRS